MNNERIFVGFERANLDPVMIIMGSKEVRFYGK